jgi:hypothetical protein
LALGRSRAYRLLSAAQIAEGRMLDATGALERGIEHARRAGSTAEIAELAHWVVWTLHEGPSPARHVLGHLDQLLGGAVDNPAARPVRHYLQGAVEGLGGNFNEGREQFARGRCIYAGLGLRQRAAQASIWEGRLELLAGRPDAAEQILRPALEALLEMGERGIVSDAAAYLALAELERGEVRKARKLASVSDNSRARDDRVGGSYRADGSGEGGSGTRRSRAGGEAGARGGRDGPRMRHPRPSRRRSKLPRRDPCLPGANGGGGRARPRGDRGLRAEGQRGLGRLGEGPARVAG